MCHIVSTYCPRNNIITTTSNGKLKTVKAILADGFDVNARDSENRTALMIASESWNKGLVQLLLGYNADVNATSKNGWTALLYAVLAGEIEIVEILLNNCANPDIKNDENGYNSLEWAVIYDLYDIAQLLMEHGDQVRDNYVEDMLFLLEKEKRNKYQDLIEVQ